MFRQDRTNPSTAVSNWNGRRDTAKGWPSTAVSSWLNGGLFGGGGAIYAGYLAGGNNTSPWKSADKLSFPDEVGSTLADVLQLNTGWTSGFSNNGVAGYTGAGYVSTFYPSGSPKIQKLLYGSDTPVNLTDLPDVAADTSAGTGSPGYGVGSCSNSGTAGYIAGGTGRVSGVSYTSNKAVKYPYATETPAMTGNILTYATGIYVGDMAGKNAGGNGYWFGGIRGTQSDAISKLVFASDTGSVITGTTTIAGYYTRACANEGTASYTTMGVGGTGANTTVQKMPFATETPAALGTGLSSGRQYMGCFGDKDVAVYFGDAGGINEYDRFATASDTRTVIDGGGGGGASNGPSGFSNSANW